MSFPFCAPAHTFSTCIQIISPSLFCINGSNDILHLGMLCSWCWVSLGPIPLLVCFSVWACWCLLCMSAQPGPERQLSPSHSALWACSSRSGVCNYAVESQEALYSLMPLNPSIWPTLELKSYPVSEKGHLWLENCLSPRNLRVYQNIYRLVNSLRAGLCFISVCDLHISWKTPWNNRWSAPVCCNPEMSFTLNRKKLLEDTFRFKI